MLQLVLSCLCTQAHAGMPKLFLGLVAPCVISHRVPHAATENVPHFPIGWGSGRDTVGKGGFLAHLAIRTASRNKKGQLGLSFGTALLQRL